MLDFSESCMPRARRRACGGRRRGGMQRAAASAIGAAIAGPAALADECRTALLPHEVAIVLARESAGAYAPAAPPEGILYVPVTFHVVQASDGSGGIPAAQLDQALLDSNKAFLPVGIQFCLVRTDIIKSSAYNPLMTGSGADALRQINVVPNTVNVYFVDTNLFCGISSFTFSAVQGIVCANSCSGLPGNPSTVPHEIGHYFDLFHTHETAFGKECTSGVNCAAAGDLVCDTPADPSLGAGSVNSACQYTGSALGPCPGDPPYAPDATNLMSYSLKQCRSTFTPQQGARALATLLAFRPELALSSCPAQCLGEITLDGKVDQADLGALLTAFGKKSMEPGFNPMADLNSDGACDQADLGLLIGNYGEACP